MLETKYDSSKRSPTYKNKTEQCLFETGLLCCQPGAPLIVRSVQESIYALQEYRKDYLPQTNFHCTNCIGNESIPFNSSHYDSYNPI